jgi:hypothetical protein
MEWGGVKESWPYMPFGMLALGARISDSRARGPQTLLSLQQLRSYKTAYWWDIHGIQVMSKLWMPSIQGSISSYVDFHGFLYTWQQSEAAETNNPGRISAFSRIHVSLFALFHRRQYDTSTLRYTVAMSSSPRSTLKLWPCFWGGAFIQSVLRAKGLYREGFREMEFG